jgi:hypothetical protein
VQFFSVSFFHPLALLWLQPSAGAVAVFNLYAAAVACGIRSEVLLDRAACGTPLQALPRSEDGEWEAAWVGWQGMHVAASRVPARSQGPFLPGPTVS